MSIICFDRFITSLVSFTFILIVFEICVVYKHHTFVHQFDMHTYTQTNIIKKLKIINGINDKINNEKFIKFPIMCVEKSSHRTHWICDGCLYIDPIKGAILMESNLMRTQHAPNRTTTTKKLHKIHNWLVLTIFILIYIHTPHTSKYWGVICLDINLQYENRILNLNNVDFVMKITLNFYFRNETKKKRRKIETLRSYLSGCFIRHRKLILECWIGGVPFPILVFSI